MKYTTKQSRIILLIRGGVVLFSAINSYLVFRFVNSYPISQGEFDSIMDSCDGINGGDTFYLCQTTSWLNRSLRIINAIHVLNFVVIVLALAVLRSNRHI